MAITDEQARTLAKRAFEIENSDFPDAFDSLARDVNDWARDKGFWDRPEGTFATRELQEWVARLEKSQKIALIHSELSELLEGLRKVPKPNARRDTFDNESIAYTNEEEELADAIIRIMDYSAHYKLRVGGAIIAKMVTNFSRPRKHGKKF